MEDPFLTLHELDYGLASKSEQFLVLMHTDTYVVHVAQRDDLACWVDSVFVRKGHSLAAARLTVLEPSQSVLLRSPLRSKPQGKRGLSRESCSLLLPWFKSSKRKEGGRSLLLPFYFTFTSLWSLEAGQLP